MDFPLIGEVKVTGKPIAQVEREIRRLVERDHIKEASVIVKIRVIPEDKDRTWQFPRSLPPPYGGEIKSKPVTNMRPDLKIEPLQRVALESKVTVKGRVKAPGIYYFDKPLIDIFEVMGKVGGTLPMGYVKKVKIHKIHRGSVILLVNMRKLLDDSMPFYILPEDTIFIPKCEFGADWFLEPDRYDD